MRPVAITIVAALLAGAGGFLLGRTQAPERVEYRDREVTKTVTREDAEARENVRILKAEVERLQTRTHREVVVVTRADGTQETRTIEDTETTRNTDARTDSERKTEERATRTAEVVREVVREKVVERRPSWRVVALGGLDGSALLRAEARPIFGALAERRLFGPLSAGAWTLNTGAVGIALSLEL